MAAAAAHDLRLPVARHIREVRRLVVGHFHNVVARPVALLALGVGEPVARVAGESEHEHIGPAVFVEVGRVGEEVLGIAARVHRLAVVDLVARFEFRAFPPVGAIDDVVLAVLVEVAGGGALGVEFIDELDGFPFHLAGGGGEDGKGEGGGEEGVGIHGGACVAVGCDTAR